MEETYFYLSVQKGTERIDCAQLYFSYHIFRRTKVWNGEVLFGAFPSEPNPSAFPVLEQYRTNWEDCVPL